MIDEDYCSYEVSKLLKEKGFDWNCHQYDFEDWEKRHSTITSIRPYNFNEDDKCISIPTHQMAMKWLREVHNIITVIEPHSYNYMEEKTSSYDFSIWCGDNYEHPFTTNYPTYEEAVEAAIKYTLENLI